jgi:hypothetical protein
MTFINQDEVCIVWRSDTALSASVRDGTGIHDIGFTIDGWSCTRPDEPAPCAHILAVKGIASVAST